MSRAKVYGLLMALAMLFMAGLCACSAQPHSAAETAPQTIVVGIDVFDPYSYLDRNGQFAGIDVELATEAFFTTWLYAGIPDDFMAGQRQPSQRRNDRLYLVMLQHERAGNQVPMGRSVYVQPSGRGCSCGQRYPVAVRSAGKRIGVQATTKAESLFLGEISSLLPEVKQVNSFETTEDMFAALRKGYVDAVAGHEALVAKVDKSG